MRIWYLTMCVLIYKIYTSIHVEILTPVLHNVTLLENEGFVQVIKWKYGIVVVSNPIWLVSL